MYKAIYVLLISFSLYGCALFEARQEEKGVSTVEEKTNSLESMIGDYGDYAIVKTQRGIAIRSNTSTTFRVSSSELLPKSDIFLNDIAYILNNTFLFDKSVLIAGYTDSSGSSELNKKLSLQRANSVMNALKKRGVDAARMTAEGWGAEEAIADNSTKEGRAINRRVEIVFLSGNTKKKCGCTE